MVRDGAGFSTRPSTPRTSSSRRSTAFTATAPQAGTIPSSTARPREFGARASKLYQMLRTGHHGVKLPADALLRLTVWLDSCSRFHGVYEIDGQRAQQRGEIVRPTLE